MAAVKFGKDRKGVFAEDFHRDFPGFQFGIVTVVVGMLAENEAADPGKYPGVFQKRKRALDAFGILAAILQIENIAVMDFRHIGSPEETEHGIEVAADDAAADLTVPEREESVGIGCIGQVFLDPDGIFRPDRRGRI